MELIESGLAHRKVRTHMDMPICMHSCRCTHTDLTLLHTRLSTHPYSRTSRLEHLRSREAGLVATHRPPAPSVSRGRRLKPGDALDEVPVLT